MLAPEAPRSFCHTPSWKTPQTPRPALPGRLGQNSQHRLTMPLRSGRTSGTDPTSDPTQLGWDGGRGPCLEVPAPKHPSGSLGRGAFSLPHSALSTQQASLLSPDPGWVGRRPWQVAESSPAPLNISVRFSDLFGEVVSPMFCFLIYFT